MHMKGNGGLDKGRSNGNEKEEMDFSTHVVMESKGVFIAKECLVWNLYDRKL